MSAEKAMMLMRCEMMKQEDKLRRYESALGWLRMNNGIALDGNHVGTPKEVFAENLAKIDEALQLNATSTEPIIKTGKEL